MALPQHHRPRILAAEAKDYPDHVERADLIVGIVASIDHLSADEQAETCGLPKDLVPGRQPFGVSCPLSTPDLRALDARLRGRRKFEY